MRISPRRDTADDGSMADRSTVPRPILIGAALMLGAAIVMTAFGPMGSADLGDDPAFATVEVRDLRFEDRADGGVLVFDAATEQRIATLEPGGGGFVRSTLRGLVRERRLSDVGGKSAFRLQRMANGSLRLGDPATGQEVHLAAFGPSNVAAFEALMTAKSEMR